MTIHIFNPHSDLALADGSTTYTPPASGIALARAGASLPMWYGENGDKFIGAVNGEWYDSISYAFDINILPTLSPSQAHVQPWGWSPQIKRQLLDMGWSDDVLPSQKELDGWRTLSSRITAVQILKELIIKESPTLLGSEVAPTRFLPYIATNIEEALNQIDRSGVSIIKLPWSNAGRGQQVSDRTTPIELRRRLTGMIRRQGAVEISPYYTKLLDFAMLWDNNTFIGYSLFETDSHGGWTHNILLSDDEIERLIKHKLGRDIDFNSLHKTLGNLLHGLSEKFNYNGPIGVDFIVGSNYDGSFSNQKYLLPIEINWRRTMGHVAHRLKNRFLVPAATGTFSILPSRDFRMAYNDVGHCQVAGNRLVHGILDLTPPGGDFRILLRTE